MRQVWIPKPGPPEVLEVREAPDPTPGPGQVRVDVEAAGVNFADVLAREGLYADAPPLPCVVGYEVAGTVDAVGDGVQPELVGAPVLALTRFGGYASKVVVDRVQAVPRPAGLDAVTAAAIPVTGLTAWVLIEVMGRPTAGERVLVHSAAGGVGLMALDLLRRRGCHAVGIASAHKHDLLRERGYAELVDSRSGDAAEVLRRGERFDLILDPVGGRSWATSLDLLAPGGRVALYGMSANEGKGALGALRNVLAIPWWRLGPVGLIQATKGALGVNMGRLWDEPERVRRWLDGVLDAVADGTLRPLVHATVPFDQAAEAHRILHRRENVGKVVLVP